MQRRFLLDVVVSQDAAILQLLAVEGEALFVRGGALLVLDLLLDGVDRVRRLGLHASKFARGKLDVHLQRLGVEGVRYYIGIIELDLLMLLIS